MTDPTRQHAPDQHVQAAHVRGCDTQQEPVSTLAAPTVLNKPVTISKWAIHRRLYNWTLSFANSPSSTWALAFISFIEAIFFPIPPFVLQIPMTLARRERAWWYATVTTVSSVLGGLTGYGLGHSFHDIAVRLFSQTLIDKAHTHLSGNVFLLTGAVVAVHPYKLFTIACGIFKIPLGAFIFASVVGRGALFFGIGGLLYFFGAPVRSFIEKYFNILTVLFGALIIGAVLVMKFL